MFSSWACDVGRRLGRQRQVAAGRRAIGELVVRPASPKMSVIMLLGGGHVRGGHLSPVQANWMAQGVK